MRLWLSHAGGVPLREQLVTQIVLGVLSGDLRPGSRLPSTRELARRYQVHPNTVSAAYQQLEQERWVESRRGSGVYVRARNGEDVATRGLALDHLIANLFHAARRLGTPMVALQKRLQRWLDQQPPDHFLLLEPDEELRAIALAELRAALPLRVTADGLGGARALAGHIKDGAIPVVLPSKAERVRKLLPPGADCVVLQVRSVPLSLLQWLPARKPDQLVAVASRWPDFLRSARTMLLAAGFETDALLFRDARKPGWQKGLRSCAAVVCDSLVAARIPPGPKVIPFALIAEQSLAELRQYQHFLGQRPS
jgi:DNA-binding transcriptional regulator YhcF (GntR family)